MDSPPLPSSPLRLGVTDPRLAVHPEGLFLNQPELRWELEAIPGRALTLDSAVKNPPAPDQKIPIDFQHPQAIAVDPCGRMLVVDPGENPGALSRFHRFWPHPPDADPEVPLQIAQRDFLAEMEGVCRRVYALAFARDGRLAVLESSRDSSTPFRLRVFALETGTLLRDWSGAPGLKTPLGLAFGPRGTLYVADPGAIAVHRLAPSGEILAPLPLPRQNSPFAVAVSRTGIIAVVDGVTFSRPALTLLWPDGHTLQLPMGLELSPSAPVGSPTALSAVFDATGRLYVGDTVGRIHLFAASASDSRAYEYRGAGLIRSMPIGGLAWHPRGWLLALLTPAKHVAEIRLVPPRAGRVPSGRFVTAVFDSGVADTVWHRIKLDADVPPGATILIESVTAACKKGLRLPFDPPPDAEEEAESKSCPACAATAAPRDEEKPTPAPSDLPWGVCLRAGHDQPDSLVQSPPGRYLRLRLTLGSNNVVTPLVRGLTLSWPRDTIARHLPAVFLEDREHRDFLQNLLAIFQAGFDDFDQRVDQIADLFDPSLVPLRHLDALAAWLAIDIPQEWAGTDPAQRANGVRKLTRDAARDYPRRGTVAGIEKAIRDRTGAAFATVMEHWKAAHWRRLGSPEDPLGSRSTPLWSPSFFQRLELGAPPPLGEAQLRDSPHPSLDPFERDAHRFTVFFPAHPLGVIAMRKRVADAVETQRPAHTEVTLRPVFPRFRVGVQATLGFDSVVGGISRMVLVPANAAAGCRLGHDTFLGPSPSAEAVAHLGAALHPRVGISTRLI